MPRERDVRHASQPIATQASHPSDADSRRAARFDGPLASNTAANR